MPDSQFQWGHFQFTNAEILALLNGGTEVVLPAPGAGKAYCVLAAIFTANCTAGAYTFTGSALIGLFAVEGAGGGAVLAGNNFQEEAAEAYPLISNGNNERVTISVRGLSPSGGDGSTTDNFENRALDIHFWTTPTGLGGGNAANTLKVSILYTIIDV